MGPLVVSPVLVDKAQIADIRLATRERTLVALHRCMKAVVGLEWRELRRSGAAQPNIDPASEAAVG